MSLKIGKVPETVLKRSIIKQIKYKRDEILVGAGVGEDCAAVQLTEDEVLVLSTDPITGTTQDIGALSVHVTANDIASSGAEVIGVMLSVLLPEGTEESELSEMMREVEETCEELRIQTIGGHTEVTRVVNQPVITVTGIGKVKKDRLITTAGAKPGDDIIVTKWIALEGTSILAKEKEEELGGRFSEEFIKEAKGFSSLLSVVKDARIACGYQVHSMHDVTEGGIFGALWEVAEASHVGLSVDLREIPVRQESIEICEFFGINPYELISSGSMLITAENGYDIVRALAEEGISAGVIGKITKGNDRILRNGDEIRYLEPPKTDELYKVL
ncbi:MAG: AIR synthase family protein [Lachnospiraceae bacterium]|nr:AIR synthase family protein [Lachnospiraceae bacterium]